MTGYNHQDRFFSLPVFARIDPCNVCIGDILNGSSIRVLNAGDEAALEAFLVPWLESSMFLASNMRHAGLVDRGHLYEGTYAAAFEGHHITGVVGHFWNQYIVLQAPKYLGQLLKTVIQKSNRPVSGFLGPNDQVLEAKELFGLKRDDFRHDEAEGLYSLILDELVVPSVLSDKTVGSRRANHDDLDLLADWLSAMGIETLDEKDSSSYRKHRRESTRKLLEAGRTWILEVGNQPVATSGFNAIIKDIAGGGIVQVGGVYTPPEYRNRGFARAVVAASLLDAQNEKTNKAVLFTAESNIPAQKAYAALGFKRIGTYRLTFLKRAISINPSQPATGDN